jgi:RsiW-degrading membrane proteinase PrsW (M82 family)
MKKKNHSNKPDDYGNVFTENASSPVNLCEQIQPKSNQNSLTIIHFYFFALLPIPIAFLYSSFLGNWIGSTQFHAVFIAPLMEEFFKISGIMLYTLLYANKIKSRSQILWAAVIASLSFAVVENMLYAYFRLADVSEEKFIMIMTFRWILLTLIHMLCALIASMGVISVWKALCANKKVKVVHALSFFCIAVFIHASYNFLILTL